MSSEHEFLKNYRLEDYERPSVTTDIAVFMIRRKSEESYRKEPQSSLSVLLIRRGAHPFKDSWALPGGFLQKGETIEECACREICEETNVRPAAIKLVDIFSEPDRDPRGWILSAAFVSILSEGTAEELGGDDAAEAQWFDVHFEQTDDGLYHLCLTHDMTHIHAVLKKLPAHLGKDVFRIAESGGLAFDHARIIAGALSALRSEAGNFGAIFDFLPEKFTLTQLQRVQETIMNISVLPANFRRKAAEYVEETEEYTSGAGHRPAKLFRKKQ
ncbi:MAG: NUDIX hydrolase [Oscillospiraceae bacterium]|nr:NUDIX hydrolase [Oscillospiraceae bacterium]